MVSLGLSWRYGYEALACGWVDVDDDDGWT